jgi:hypothetical protein
LFPENANLHSMPLTQITFHGSFFPFGSLLNFLFKLCFITFWSWKLDVFFVLETWYLTFQIKEMTINFSDIRSLFSSLDFCFSFFDFFSYSLFSNDTMKFIQVYWCKIFSYISWEKLFLCSEWNFSLLKRPESGSKSFLSCSRFETDTAQSCVVSKWRKKIYIGGVIMVLEDVQYIYHGLLKLDSNEV